MASKVLVVGSGAIGKCEEDHFGFGFQGSSLPASGLSTVFLTQRSFFVSIQA
jgi:hypothetical protein